MEAARLAIRSTSIRSLQYRRGRMAIRGLSMSRNWRKFFAARWKTKGGMERWQTVHLGRIRRADDGEPGACRDHREGTTLDASACVPVHIDALAVGDNVLFDWASPAPDFSRLRTEYRIGTDLRFPFQAGKKMAGKVVPKGIHLHFRLPPMLTHRSGEDTKFPLAPNRWLVQR